MEKGKNRIEYDDEEDEPLYIEEKEFVKDNTIAFCLLGKLFTARSYNTFGLMETMKKLWCPTQGMVCRELGDNLVSFQFKCKRDMDRVLGMAPWQFNKHILVLKKISEEVQPSMMKFDSTPFWIRLYDVPLRGRNKQVIHQIGSRFGEVEEIDLSTIGGISRSVRIKVQIDLNKPMRRGTKIRVGSAEPCWIPITYKRLSSFCYWCGHLGHTTKDCERLSEVTENGEEVTEEKMPFGEWMKASPMKRTEVISEQGTGTKSAEMRRSLFPKSIKETELGSCKDQTMPPPHGLTEERKPDATIAIQDTENQVQKLLDSLSKVEVGGKEQQNQSGQSNHNPQEHVTITPQIPAPTTQSPVNQITKLTKNIPTSQKGPHIIPPTNTSHPQNIKHPTTNLIQTQPTTKTLPHTPPLANHTHLSDLPYTPTNVLRAMLEKQGTLKPYLRPTTDPQHLNPTAQIKIEPPSPVNHQKGDSKSVTTGNVQKKWRRQVPRHDQKKEKSQKLGEKRKDDAMEVDHVNLGSIKRTKNTNASTSNETAETAMQLRRTL